MGKIGFAKQYLKKGLILLVCFLYPVFGSPAFGVSHENEISPEKIFSQANNAYQKGDFAEAAQIYQQLCDEGYRSGNLYYNLGNSYYKLGSKGRAILNYERAKRLIPGDADLKANLNYALAGVQEGVSDWKYDLVKFLTGIASLEQLVVSGSICFFGLVVLIILGLIKPALIGKIREGNYQKWRQVIIAGLSIILFIYCALGLLTYWDHSREQAVAVKAGEVRFEPSEAATLYYHLGEGTRVQVLEQKGNWAKVKRTDGKRGWVVRDCLELI